MSTLDDVMARRLTTLPDFDAHMDAEGAIQGMLFAVFPDGTWAYATGPLEDAAADTMDLTATPPFLPMLLRALGLVGDEHHA